MKRVIQHPPSLWSRFKEWLKLLWNRWKRKDDIASNLEKFPTMGLKEVALVRAERSTGIVLDEACNYAVYPGQKIYTVFDNLDKGLKYARQIIEERNNIECVLYGIDQNVLHCLNLSNYQTF